MSHLFYEISLPIVKFFIELDPDLSPLLAFPLIMVLHDWFNSSPFISNSTSLN